LQTLSLFGCPIYDENKDLMLRVQYPGSPCAGFLPAHGNQLHVTTKLVVLSRDRPVPLFFPDQRFGFEQLPDCGQVEVLLVRGHAEFHD
jgi:hypothetical protein